MSPIDYNIDVKSPFESTLKGFQSGLEINGMMQKQQQQELALQEQQQMQRDLGSLATKQNPTGQDYAAMMTKYPKLSEQLKRPWDVMNQEQQQSKLNQATQVYSALHTDPKIASKLLRDQAATMRNSGMEQDAKAADTLAQWVDMDPASAKTSVGLMLSSRMGPEKFATTFQALGDQQRAADKAPAELTKAQADATVATVNASNAVTKTSLDNQKSAEDIVTAQANRRIAELDVQIKQANSETDRGKLQLEREKVIQERDLKKQTVAADSQTQLDTLNQSMTTVGELMNHPGLNSGTGVGSSFASWFNGTDAKDFRLQVETLKSQQFLTAAKELKGMGALSDAEGARLEKAVASLDPNMSTNQFKNNLGVIKNTLEKAQAKVVASGKLPTSGGAFIMKHPVYGDVKDGDVNRLLGQFPGATRQQVLDYLRSSGGK